MFKKLLAFSVTIMLCVSLTSCNYVGREIDSLIHPPKPAGKMLYQIQQALDESIDGSSIIMKYPRSGSYLSAFVLFDINSDGKDEALAFYADELDSKTHMHINVIVQTEDGWKSVDDKTFEGDGIERVDFADLDGNGNYEIIVGWSKYSNLERQLAVYTLYDNKISLNMQQKFNRFAVCDLDGDGITDLVMINLDTVEKASTAKLFTIKDNVIIEKGSVALDGKVSSYNEPMVSVLRGGRTAVYVDAVKASDSLITELIYYEDGKLKNPFYNNETKENIMPLRPNNAASMDIDLDGVIEIPYMSPFPGYESSGTVEIIYKTAWRNYDGQRFETPLTAYMNYDDGYYFVLNNSWSDYITVSRSSAQRLSTFSVWDPLNLKATQELLRIMVLDKIEWDENNAQYADFLVLEQTEDYVYLAKQSATVGGEYSLSAAELKNNFKVLGSESNR